MDYNRIYNNIISKAKLENRSKKISYFERHHIIPRSIGGSNDKENLVLLTAKEHFICHHLLTKIYDDSKLKFAFWAMCNQLSGDVKREYRVNSSTYERARKEFAIVNSIRHKGKRMPLSHSIANSKRLKENNPHKPGEDSHLYGIQRTDEVKKKISQTKRNHPERNAAFRGFYITPYGKFASTRHFNEATGLPASFCGRCKRTDIINKKIISYNKDLSYDDIGKTFKELGWDFEPVLP